MRTEKRARKSSRVTHPDGTAAEPEVVGVDEAERREARDQLHLAHELLGEPSVVVVEQGDPGAPGHLGRRVPSGGDTLVGLPDVSHFVTELPGDVLGHV